MSRTSTTNSTRDYVPVEPDVFEFNVDIETEQSQTDSLGFGHRGEDPEGSEEDELQTRPADIDQLAGDGGLNPLGPLSSKDDIDPLGPLTYGDDAPIDPWDVDTMEFFGGYSDSLIG